jgi:hypothetical protein
MSRDKLPQVRRQSPLPQLTDGICSGNCVGGGLRPDEPLVFCGELAEKTVLASSTIPG